jgi:predicted enzyme related to lactoylglutathione lyase
MERVTGLGGFFFKANDPQTLYAWYEKHLGMKGKPGEGGMFQWRDMQDPSKVGLTAWSIFKRDTKYFEPGKKDYMLNLRVKNLDELLTALRAEGVWIDEKREDHEYGRFAWIMDPEGNRIELWEPPANG